METRLLSGTDIPDEVALAVGRFIMLFGYLEFQLWIWFNEIFNDEQKSKEFVRKQLAGKVSSIKSAIQNLEMKKEDRKLLLSFMCRISRLAESRNLVCHNPYLTIGGEKGNRDNGAILGSRSATLNFGAEIRNAKLPNLIEFEKEAARMCAECHQLFPIIQTAIIAGRDS